MCIFPFVTTPPPLSVHMVLFGETGWGRGTCDPGLASWSHSEELRKMPGPRQPRRVSPSSFAKTIGKDVLPALGLIHC